MQIAPRHLKAIGGFVHHLESLLRNRRERCFKQQNTLAFRRTASDTPAQLMQLRQAKSFRVLDHHHTRVRHIHTHLDHRGRDQYIQFARFKLRHDFALLRRLHFTVNQTDPRVRQLRTEILKRINRGLQFQRLRLLDQRTHPVNLFALGHILRHFRHHLVASPHVDQLRFHRRAIRRQLINQRHIQIGKIRQRQRARNRRGTHHQLMRRVLICALAPHAEHAFAHFAAQRQTLLHTKTMLLINHRQTQIIKTHTLLNQRVRTDHDLDFIALQRLVHLLFILFRHAGSQPCHRHAQRREPLVQFIKQLLGQNLRRRHHRRLQTRADALGTGQTRHHGFARTNIALQQSMHRQVLLHIIAYARPCALLRPRERETQLG